MNIQEAREIVAAAWCQPATSDRVMDPALAEEFAKILLNTVHDCVNEEVEQWRKCVRALEEELSHSEKETIEEINELHTTAESLKDVLYYERSRYNDLYAAIEAASQIIKDTVRNLQ